MTVTYGESLYEGSWACDRLCTTPYSNCIEDLDFFYVKESGGSFGTEVDGIVGLARPNQDMFLAPHLDYTGHEFMLDKLNLTDKFFSTRFNKGLYSWIDFGKPDQSQIADEPVEIKVFDDYFWSSQNEAIRIGEHSS